MSSQQGKGCPEIPINQTEPAQYSQDTRLSDLHTKVSQDSQSDSDHKFEVTAVNPNAESTRLDGQHGPVQTSGSTRRPTGPVHRA